MWIKKQSKPWEGRIYIAGDIEQAKQRIREMAYNQGMCVTVSLVDYIYTGGEEKGLVVGLIQYPRFEVDEQTLEKNLIFLAENLATRLCQKSFTVSTPNSTIYFRSDLHTK